MTRRERRRANRPKLEGSVAIERMRERAKARKAAAIDLYQHAIRTTVLAAVGSAVVYTSAQQEPNLDKPLRTDTPNTTTTTSTHRPMKTQTYRRKRHPNPKPNRSPPPSQPSKRKRGKASRARRTAHRDKRRRKRYHVYAPPKLSQPLFDIEYNRNLQTWQHNKSTRDEERARLEQQIKSTKKNLERLSAKQKKKLGAEADRTKQFQDRIAALNLRDEEDWAILQRSKPSNAPPTPSFIPRPQPATVEQSQPPLTVPTEARMCDHALCLRMKRGVCLKTLRS